MNKANEFVMYRQAKHNTESRGSKRKTTKQNAYLNILTLVLKCTTLSPF